MRRGVRSPALTALLAGIVWLTLAATTEAVPRAGMLVTPQSQEAAARAAFERGEEALQAGRLAEAVAAFREVLAFAPDDPGIRFRLGQALFLSGDPEGIEHLERARDLTNGRPEVSFLLAQAYLAGGRYRDSAEALDAVEAVAPGVPDVKLARGELCYLVGRLDGARRHLERAVELGPEGWSAPLYRLGLTAVAERRWSEAVGWLERAVAVQPGDAEAWLLLASARKRGGDPTGGLAAMEQAVRAAPDNVLARLLLADEYAFADRVEELVEQVETTLARDPDNAAALSHRASRAMLAGDFTGALADLDRLLATAPVTVPATGGANAVGTVTTDSQLRVEARRRRVDALSRLGRTDEAIAAARELVRDAPDFADGIFVLGNLLVRAGDPEGRSHLERFKMMSDARVRRGMGDNFLETTGDLELAEAEFTAALAAWPDDRRAMIGLARVRRLQGRPTEALDLLERSRGASGSIEPWFSGVILSLADAGRHGEAQRAWEQARALGLPFGPEVWRVVHPGEFGCS